LIPNTARHRGQLGDDRRPIAVLKQCFRFDEMIADFNNIGNNAAAKTLGVLIEKALEAKVLK
jgi:hypothetical protein